MAGFRKDPLFHPGWIEFNVREWGVAADHVVFTPGSGRGWRLETVLYTDERGMLVQPPYNPYLPVHFECSGERLAAINRRKRIASQELAGRFKHHTLGDAIALSPVMSDIRPFRWAGLDATPHFTYHVDLHTYRQEADANVFSKARKAGRLGYSCEISKDYEAVVECLKGPQERKGFDYQVDARQLAAAAELVGEEGFLCIVARNSEREAIGARVLIYTVGGIAMALFAGIKTASLNDSINNLLAEYVLEFLARKGCTVLDFVGADMPGIAQMKEAWGGALVCYYAITPGR